MIKIIEIDGTTYEYEENATYSEHQMERLFDEMLDECYDEIQICGYRYSPSRALSEVDPIAYREEFLAWISGKIDDDIIAEVSDGVYIMADDMTEIERE